MPIYIGDYLADTIGLSNAQHGAYLLSMMAYWRKGESLTNAELQQAAGKDFDRISQFYVLVDNRWYHKRIDIELAAARERIVKMRDLSSKAVAKRRAIGQLPDEPHG